MRLEPLARSHADGLLEAARGQNDWDWMSQVLTTAESLDRWIGWSLDVQAKGEEYPFAVVLRGSGRVVGSTRYMDLRPQHRGVEIGWTWYATDVWDTAVNPESKYLLLRHAFEDWGAIRVALKTDVLNLRSQAAIRKLGAKYEGALRNHYVRRDGSYRDSVFFSIVESEWPEVKTALERRLEVFSS